MENQSQPVKQDGYIRCYMCGHIDNLEYCSNCGHPLRNPEEKVGVLLFLMEIIRDILAPLATGITTLCLFLFQPHNAYEAIFNGTKTNSTSTTIEKTKLPLITNFWENTLGKKQKIFEPSGYLIFVMIVYLYIYNASSKTPLSLFDNIPPLLKDAVQEIESIGAFTVILLTCMFFAVLSKIIYNQLSWSNAYALSIYLNGTNILILTFWGASLHLIDYIFPQNSILWFLWFLISLPILLIILVVHSVISPVRFFPKIINIPLSRLITLLALGYISFPIILFASTFLIVFMIGIPTALAFDTATTNIYTQICCGTFLIFFFGLVFFLAKIVKRIPQISSQEKPNSL